MQPLPPFFCAVSLLAAAHAEVRLPAVFGHHMVLQRDAEVAIWGFAERDETVQVRGDWMPAAASATADAHGRWQVRIRTAGAGGPHRIAISGRNELSLDDVLFGEVWLASGQSNMEMRVHELGAGHAGAIDWEAELRGALPPIRLFDVVNTAAASPQPDCRGAWSLCTAERVRDFSAVAWFFGRELHRQLGVPIGLITSDLGGTVAEAWTSRTTLAGFPAFATALAELDQRATPGQSAARPEDRRERALADWWQRLGELDPGSKAGWQQPRLDDSAWQEMRLPCTWTQDLADFDGIVWFRRTLELPAAWVGQELTLELGPIDDMDDTWVNGQRVGGMHDVDQWETARSYRVPAALVTGRKCVVAVRVLDTGGLGGINGTPEQLALRRGADRVALAGPWRARVGSKRADLPAWPRGHDLDANTPTVLFNGMIAPLLPFGIRGVLWYQGESNRERAFQYRSLLPALIADWRTCFAQPALPFYLVQIAPYQYRNDQGEAAELREAQLLTTQRVPHTGLAVTMDLGDPRDIHPSAKEEVGRRLALWALAQDYGRKELPCSGPVYQQLQVSGASVRLAFAHTAGALRAQDGKPLRGFTIAGADRKFVAAEAVIAGDAVVVRSAEVAQPVAVRFAWGAADQPNLANAAGLPASSFRTDDWPCRTEKNGN